MQICYMVIRVLLDTSSRYEVVGRSLKSLNFLKYGCTFKITLRNAVIFDTVQDLNCLTLEKLLFSNRTLLNIIYP